MVSISNWLTLGLIGGGILAFYKLGGASGIGSKIGGGFSNLYDSFTKALNPLSEATERLSENIQNPALNPILVAQERLLELLTTDPNLAEGRYVEPASITTDSFPKSQTDLITSFKPKTARPRIVNDATTVNTGGFIQQKTTSIQPTSWKSSSLSGVSITGSYSSSSGYSGGSTDSSTGTSNAGVTGGSTGGSTGGTQPSSRRGTYTGGRR